MQRLSQLLSFLSDYRCDFYIAHTCYLPQVSLNEHQMPETKLITHNFERVPIILSGPFFELCKMM